MATIQNLIEREALFVWEPDLDPGELPNRCIYTTPEFVEWFNNDLAAESKDRSTQLDPNEQLAQFFNEFCRGDGMVLNDDFRKLIPLTDHVWEIRTADVRALGWFPCQSTFIGVVGVMKRQLPRFSHYAPLIRQVIDFRDALDLDPPKFLIGNTINEVV